jgi:hypothetical protein
MAKWLDKYEQGGMVLKQKTHDNYGKKPNPNDVQMSAGPGFVGEGYNIKGRDYSPSWGGQFQNGGVMNKASMFASLPTPTDIYNYGRRESEEIAKRAKLMWESKSLNPTLPMHSDTLYPGNKYKDAFMKTPNIRTEKDESFKKGHSLTNEQKAIVLHHTGYTDTARDNDVSWAMRGVDAQFRKPGESSHVVIDFNGNRYNYANPNQVTFHAGKSSMNNKNDVNDFGVGVEFQGDTDQRPLTKEQIESFIEYAAPIIKKNKIPINNVITHKQIRKNYIDKNLNDKDVQSKPDVNDKEYSKIIQALKKKGVLQMGGSIPGAVGFTYARTQDPAPSNGPYAKKTLASAQNGKEMKFWQDGLDFKPKTISKNGSVIKDDMGQWAHPGEVTEISGNTMATHGYGDVPLYVVPDKGSPRIVQANTGTQKFPGATKFTEFPMAQDGGWLDKYSPEPMRQDATRNVVPRKMTDKERVEAVATSDQAQKRALNSTKEVITERQKNKATKGDLNTPGSWHIKDKARFFPSSVGGVGEMVDEYINPAAYVGILGDALGESVAARDPKGIATSLGLSAIGGGLGFDPIGGGIKAVKSFAKPSFTDGKEAFDFINNMVRNGQEDQIVKILTKKTGKTSSQLENEFGRAIGNDGTIRDPEYIIRHANMLSGKNNLPKFPKSLKELDETAGKLVSQPYSGKFDNSKIVARTNEILKKGVGIKKKDIPIELKHSKSSAGEFELWIDDNKYPTGKSKSGTIDFNPNFRGVDKSLTFTDWLKGKTPTTKYNTYAEDATPAVIKTGDFPYQNRMDLEGTGIGAETAEAFKQALNEEGLQLHSSKSHTDAGKLRYLTEFLNNRKQVVDYSENPNWINRASALKDQLGGKSISKKEVKEYMRQYPELAPTYVRFQYDNGGWLNKYK